MNETVTDSLETMLLMLMDGSHHAYKTPGKPHLDLSTAGGAMKGNGFIEYDITERVKSDVMIPRSVFTTDLTESRTLAVSPELLLAHPADILGEEMEAALFHNGSIKWMGYRRCRKPPKRVATIGKAVAWYEQHFRVIGPDGSGTYQKRFIPVSRSGYSIVAKMDGLVMCDPAEATLNMCGACSIVEDSHRSNALLASVADSVEVKFRVPLDAYKEIFALRDAPMTQGGRRKAILHWVAKHIRRSPRGNESTVREHTRGIQEFIIDGMRVRLQPYSAETRLRG